MGRDNVRAKARGLGAELADLRRQADMSLREVGEHLDWSASTLCRIENGMRDSTPEEIAALLVIYKVTGAKNDRMVNMARTLDQSGWCEVSPAGLSVQLAALCAFEKEATKIGGLAMIAIPGLLQTANYTRALMAGAEVPPDSIEKRVSTRLERQAILSRRQPPVLHMILDEAVLHRAIGGPAVMAEQLRHLVEMSARPNISVQVLRQAVHPGVDGRYVTLEFRRPAQPFVHLENLRASLFVDEPSDVQVYLDITANLAGKALDPSRSREFLAHLTRRYEAKLE